MRRRRSSSKLNEGMAWLLLLQKGGVGGEHCCQGLREGGREGKTERSSSSSSRDVNERGEAWLLLLLLLLLL